MTAGAAPLRCGWANSDPLLQHYHDHEWGVPQHHDVALFEAVVLDGAQAGLSWLTVLKKRAAYRQAFDHFDPVRVAAYDEAKVSELLTNPGIIRNRAKILAAVHNANRFLEVQAEFGSFDTYIWRFVDGKPRQNGWRALAEVPASTPESDAVSKDLRARGFKFAGSVICYAFMQACGLVNDHLVDCFRYRVE